MLYPTYLLLELLFGRGLAAATDFGVDFDARVFPMLATLLGVVAMMNTYLTRGMFRDLEALGPALRGGEATFAELQQQLRQFGRRRLWAGGLVGLAFGWTLGELAVGRWSHLLTGEWSLRDVCVVAIGSAFWIIGGRGAVCLIDGARRYSKLGERDVEIDLLDLRPISPLTRQGLRLVLFLVILMAAVMTIATVRAPPAPSSRIVALLLACLWSLPLAAAAFLLPVRGLRRQIQVRKGEKLTQIRDDIRRNEELMAGSGTHAAEAGAKLPGLMAMEKRIESVREWPFDAPTLTRFFLYVAIPLGSWICGALVERLLGAALD